MKSRSLIPLSLSIAASLFLVFALAGPTVAHATYKGANGRIAFTAQTTGTWQLYTMNPDGSDLFQVTNLPPTENLAWFPDYSPDGTRIVFCHDMTGALELYVINADGTGLVQITHDSSENIFPRCRRTAGESSSRICSHRISAFIIS